MFRACLLCAAAAFLTPAFVSAQPDAPPRPPRAPGLTLGVPASLTSAVSTAPTLGGQPAPWLANLAEPDMPVTWHPMVVRYLERFRDSRRGRRQIRAWVRRSQAYGAMIARTLRQQNLPEDLRCVAMAESGFDPTVRSRRGAVGMWQFVERTGEEYGLHVNRFVDERMDPVRSTEAAARFLGDLYQRTGRWELALAAYNMGYPALLRAIRKYNTNDYWRLAELEAGLPFETTVYVAKIMACTVVMRNLETLGFDPPAQGSVDVEPFEVGSANLGQLARAAGADRSLIASLNPHLRRGRTPPGQRTRIYIPRGSADAFARAWARIRRQDATSVSYVVRFGENLRAIARRYGTSVGALRRRNDFEADESIRPGMAILVPGTPPAETEEPEEIRVAVPPGSPEALDGRRRIFYRIQRHDTVEEIAGFFHVDPAELRRWNGLDEAARLQSGMMLQLFVAREFDLSLAVVFREGEVRVLQTGSEDFFNDYEARQGRVRFIYTVESGDTMRSLARRFSLSTGSLARINHIGRRSDLEAGQRVVVYTSEDRVPAAYRRAAREDTSATGEPESDAAPSEQDNAPSEQSEESSAPSEESSAPSEESSAPSEESSAPSEESRANDAGEAHP